MGANEGNGILALNVRFMREQRELSQDDLAILSGLRKQTISKIENEEFKKAVDEIYVEKLAAAFHVPPDALTESNMEIKSLIKDLVERVRIFPLPKEQVANILKLGEMCQNRGPREKSESLLLRGDYEYSIGANSVAYEFYESAFELAHKTKDKLLIRKATYKFALVNMMLGIFNRANILINNMISSAEDEDTKARGIFQLGYLYYNQGLYDEAELQYTLALDLISDAPKNVSFKAKCYQTLGAIYQKVGRLDDAISASNKALELAEICGDLMSAIYSSKTLGEAKSNQGDREGAVKWFSKGLEFASLEKLGRKFEYCMLAFMLALEKDDYPAMTNMLHEAAKSDGPSREIAQMYETAAEYAFSVSKFEESRLYFKKANQLLRNS